MSRLNLGKDLYLAGRIGWRGLNKDEYLEYSDYKIINATALMDGYVDWNNCGFISTERYYESEEIMLQEGDILISKDGTLGKIGYVKNLEGYCTVASGVFVLRNTNPEIVDFNFLYHLLKSEVFKDFVKRNKSLGSTINHLYQRDLENFEVDLPDIETQKEIASVLDSIDEKIENCKKQNKLIMDEVKTIFDFYFLQYNFPNKNGNPYRENGGKFKYISEMDSEIPENWEVGNLYDIANYINGLACQNHRPKNNENYLPVIKIKEMNMGYSEDTEICSANANKKYHIVSGDILFSWSATLKTCIWGASEGVLNQHIFKVEPTKYGKYYTFFQLDSYLINFKKMAASRKTTMGHITSQHIKQSRISLPPKEVADIFEAKTKDLMEKAVNCDVEINELTKLREFYLPQFMCGKLTIK